jgi:hypothetical protein
MPNRLGRSEARDIRDTAAQLAEIDNLHATGALQEVLVDLSYALANLAGPIGALLDVWADQQDEETPTDMPDVDSLTDVAAALRHCADRHRETA